ncbi:MAG: hypothetical protein R3B84_10925 [Zavarzinella sp.]
MDKMTPSVFELLNEIAKLGVKVSHQSGNLILDPASKVPPSTIERVREMKSELVKWLTNAQTVHPEHQQMFTLIAMMKQAQERLVRALDDEGRKIGWPRIQLSTHLHLLEGEQNWKIFLTHPCRDPDLLKLLLDAILLKRTAYTGSGK